MESNRVSRNNYTEESGLKQLDSNKVVEEYDVGYMKKIQAFKSFTFNDENFNDQTGFKHLEQNLNPGSGYNFKKISENIEQSLVDDYSDGEMFEEDHCDPKLREEIKIDHLEGEINCENQVAINNKNRNIFSNILMNESDDEMDDPHLRISYSKITPNILKSATKSSKGLKSCQKRQKSHPSQDPPKPAPSTSKASLEPIPDLFLPQILSEFSTTIPSSAPFLITSKDDLLSQIRLNKSVLASQASEIDYLKCQLSSLKPAKAKALKAAKPSPCEAIQADTFRLQQELDQVKTEMNKVTQWKHQIKEEKARLVQVAKLLEKIKTSWRINKPSNPNPPPLPKTPS
ncbi:unnamed protein product [Moneuplotes crassus]|uniref:Uncharacterized protein n=1 Tax=Euplotes crassus TaxID=5936 RepID=A0AAD1XJ00_EUPCR|nr:unnamed protein product [Moneuplotes crassus]